MQKILVWATFIAAALATNYGGDPTKQKDTTDPAQCTSQKNQQNPNQIIKYVEVGGPNGTLKYNPESVSFLDEDPQKTKEWFVVFKFNPKNHTVTESSFAEPCKPIALTNASAITDLRPGVKSGFVPVTGTEDFVRTFTIKLNDTKPMWLYCGQQPHCQKGMVMVINQAKNQNEKTLEAYRAKAMAIPIPAPSGAGPAPPPDATPPPAVTPAPSATDSAGAQLSPSSSVTASVPLVSVFSGAAAPTQRPVHFVALGGLAVAGAVALL